MQTINDNYKAADEAVQALDETTSLYLDFVELTLNLTAAEQLLSLPRPHLNKLFSFRTKGATQARILNGMLSDGMNGAPLNSDEKNALLPFFDRFVTLVQDELDDLSQQPTESALIRAINSTLQDLTGNPKMTVHVLKTMHEENERMRSVLLGGLQILLIDFMLCLLCDPLLASLCRLKKGSFTCGYMIGETMERLELDYVWLPALQAAAEIILKTLEGSENPSEAKERAISLLQSPETMSQLTFLSEFGAYISEAEKTEREFDFPKPEHFDA